MSTDFPNSVIQTEGLRKSFGRTGFGETEVLRGIDLAVPEGAIYALVGANGAGKTTLIKVLMNILRATAGRASVLGWDSRTLTGDRFCSIGYVSENQEMPDAMTVGAMLDYTRVFYPMWDRELERALIQQFDLPLGRKLRHLSRGMRMKAAFVSSLAYRPALMVLDEPLSGLDPLVRDELIDGLLERAPETTIFLSSHDLAEIESFSSHVGYLEDGRILFSEEMTALTARFREVTITLAEPIAPPALLPAALPLEWLLPEAVDHVVRFVHSAYRGAESERELRERFPTARTIESEPMPLRAIFLAMARSGRKQRGAQRGPQPPQLAEKERVDA
ncbi:MAG TPA: ABC transporter ATP-binding protein [Acidobacteriaceae bacterium]